MQNIISRKPTLAPPPPAGLSPTYTPEQVLQLQRTIGNKAVQRLIINPGRGQAPPSIQRNENDDISSEEIVVIADRKYSESDSLGGDDGITHIISPEEEEQYRQQAITTGLQQINQTGTLQNQAYDDYVYEHLFDKIVEGKESEISDAALKWMAKAAQNPVKPGSVNSLKKSCVPKAPRLEPFIEEARIASESKEFRYLISRLKSGKLIGLQDATVVLMHNYYKGQGPIQNPPNFDEFKSLIESEQWVWITKCDTEEKAHQFILARDAMNKSLYQGDPESDPAQEMAEGTGQTVSTLGSVFNISQGAKIITQIHSTSGGGTFLAKAMENLTEFILGQAFAGLAIGFDLLKAFRYQKRRRDGYKAAMERTGVDSKGKSEAQPDSAQAMEDIRVGKAAYYAYNKTKRAFRTTMVKLLLRVVRWISWAITALSGGTTAMVTATLALASDITRNMIFLGRKMKGIWKWLRNKRGKARKHNANELLQLAHGGNENALQTIMDVNPFDEIQTGTKLILTMHGIPATPLPRPGSVEEFKTSLKSGYYSKEKPLKLLETALSNSMKSF